MMCLCLPQTGVMRNSRLVGAVLLSSLLAACGSGGSQQHATALASQAAADRSSAQTAASQAAQDRAAAEVLASQAARDKAAAAATSKATEAKATAAAATAKTAAAAAKTAEAKATAMKVEAAAAKAAEAKATATKTAAAAAAAAEAVKTAAAAVRPTATPVAGAPSAVANGDSGQTSFDKQYAWTVAGDIVDAIKTIDGRLGDGIAVDSGLSVLSPEYGYLESAGVPPGVRASNYIPRLRTLGSFAQQAADVYIDKPTEALAKYTVLRAETKPVFDQLNAATGSHFKLPS